jgi:hypothetical protein
MSASGFFELLLICDEKTCTVTAVYRDNTRLEAKAKARYQGWYITRRNEAYCPDHREKHAA